jgi:hypothetical protein
MFHRIISIEQWRQAKIYIFDRILIVVNRVLNLTRARRSRTAFILMEHNILRRWSSLISIEYCSHCWSTRHMSVFDTNVLAYLSSRQSSIIGGHTNSRIIDTKIVEYENQVHAVYISSIDSKESYTCVLQQSTADDIQSSANNKTKSDAILAACVRCVSIFELFVEYWPFNNASTQGRTPAESMFETTKT